MNTSRRRVFLTAGTSFLVTYLREQSTIKACVGRCGPGVQTLTLFKTQFSDFHIPFETEFNNFRPYLRHLTQVIPRLGLERNKNTQVSYCISMH